MSVRVFYDILNQKGTPAMYTDTLANRPAFGFQGRLFISTDSGQIFEDTGTAWTLVADAGVGGGTLSSVCLNGNTTATGIVITAGGLSSNSITNTGITAGSVVYAGTGGLMSQSNSTFFWDSTNNRLGINNASPGAPLDIHGTGTQMQINGTGSNNSYIQFQNAGVSKWRIGNTYNAGANSFDIYNNGLTNTPFSINSSTNAITLSANVTTTGIQNVQNGLNLGYASGGATASYTNIYGSTNGVNFALANGTGGANFIFQTLAGYNYTFPATTGTLALTSNLSSYLPLSGGSLTGNLLTNSYISIQNGLGTNQIYLTKSSGDVYGTIQTEAGGNKFSLGNVSAIGTLGTPNITWTSGAQVGINNSSPSYELDVTGSLRSTTSAYIATSSGKLGVGTTSPTNKLTISNDGNAASALRINDTNANASFLSISASNTDAAIIANGTSAIPFDIYTGGSARVRITSVGSVGIGNVGDSAVRLGVTGTSTSSAAYAFIAYDSTANALLALRNDGLIFTGTRTNSPYNYSTSGRSAILDSSGNFGYLVSTRESKSNIESIKNIDFINKLNPVSFNYRKKDLGTNNFTDELYDNITYGFIADEVEKVNKDLVFYNEDGSLAGVEYNNMIAILTKAIQELNEKLVRNNIN